MTITPLRPRSARAVKAARPADRVTPPALARSPVARPDLRGLCAIAVALVVLADAGVPGLGGGGVGIDVVLVVSGFLVTALLLGEIDGATPAVASFYARCVRSTVPLSALVVVLTVVGAYVAGGTAYGDATAVDGGWAGVFWSDVHLASTGADHTAGLAQLGALQHFWVVALMAQFCVVWPLLLLVVARAVPRDSAIRRALLVFELGGLVLVSLWYAVVTSATSPEAAYFSPFAHAWELAVGALAAVLLRHARPRPGVLGPVTALLGLVLLGAAAAPVPGAMPEVGGTAALEVLAAVLAAVLVVVGGQLWPAGAATRLLGSAGLHRLGERSFGFYLWHLPLLVLPTVALGPLGPVLTLLLVLAALALAAVTHRLVERPVRHWPGLERRPAVWSLALGAALVGVVLASLVAAQSLHRVADVASAAPSAPSAATTAAQDAGDPLSRPTRSDLSGLPVTTTIRQAVAEAVGLESVPAGVKPRLGRLDRRARLTEAEAACEQAYGVTTAERCFLGSTSASSTLVLWGDSRAAMWSPALDALGRAAGVRIAVFAKDGCAPLLGVELWHPAQERPYTECSAYNDSVLSLVEDLAPDAVILTGAFRGWAWTEDGSTPIEAGTSTGAHRWTPTEGADQVWDTGLGSTLDALSSTGARISVLGDSAYPLRDTAGCLRADPASLVACGVSYDDGVDAAHHRAERASAEAGGATYVPTTQWLCTREACPPVVGDTVVWVDGDHLTRQYSLLLTRALGRALGIIETAETGNAPLVAAG